MPENTLRQSLAKHLTMTACEGLQMERRSRRCANVLHYHTDEGEGPAPARPACLDFLNLCQPRAVETFVKPNANALRQPQGTKLYRRGEG